VAAALSLAPDVRLASDAFPDEVSLPDASSPTGGWGDLALGVIAGLRRAGVLRAGAHVAFSTSVPPGAGLSSSAAAGVAAAAAALAATAGTLGASAVARLCQRAEHEYLGVPSGLMDETAVLLGRAGQALLFDPELEEVTPVDVPGEAAWLVVESGVTRELRSSEYGARAGEAAEALGLARLRLPGLDRLGDLTPGEVADLDLPEPLNRRARHIASEVMRVRMGVASLEADNLEAFGELMVTSHRSLARDCEVSTPELDELVEVALAAGALGARLMGAGFGGSVLALAERGSAARVAQKLGRRYRTPGGGAPRVHQVALVDGVMSAG